MVLPVDLESRDYRFYKTLNHDVKLQCNEYGEWDIVFDNTSNDWCDCTGTDSLVNACIIAIMTRFDELDGIGILEDGYGVYDGFGCRVHELVKRNKSFNVVYQMELFITETLQSMRRVKYVHWVNVTDSPDDMLYDYRVDFCITPLSDAGLEDKWLDRIEDTFYI